MEPQRSSTESMACDAQSKKVMLPHDLPPHERAPDCRQCSFTALFFFTLPM